MLTVYAVTRASSTLTKRSLYMLLDATAFIHVSMLCDYSCAHCQIDPPEFMQRSAPPERRRKRKRDGAYYVTKVTGLIQFNQN